MPPAHVWRDWLLVAAVAALTVADILVRDEPVWRLLAAAYGVVVVLSLLWRRSKPLTSVALGVGVLLLVDLGSVIAGSRPFYPFAGAAVVVLVYSLFRWGTGRQVVIGAAVVLGEWTLSTASDFSGPTDAAGGIAVLLFAATLGLALRYRRIAHTQQLENVRLHERELLARELHDTVAHHVSAIAIQAQAGAYVADGAPAAARALATIEAEAVRTLTEMRAIVDSLRQGDPPGPAGVRHALGDIDDLANEDPTRGPRIEVERCGDLDDLSPALAASLYRVAQESITNARRHARHPTCIHVRLFGDSDTVLLTVSDDGARVSASSHAPGYGLTGMAERVTLLGGHVQAGPRSDQGWVVEAVIPRRKVRA